MVRPQTAPIRPSAVAAARVVSPQLSRLVDAQVAAPERRKLPRGATSLPREVVKKEQRKRLVPAIARVVAEKGYADVTVTDITAAAGVSRSTFYQLFLDKEERFLFGFSKLSKAHLSEVRRAIREDAPHPEQLLAALTTCMRCIDADMTLARAFIAEAESATTRSRVAFAATQGTIRSDLLQWLDEFRSDNPEVPPADDLAVSLMMSGLSGHVVARVRSGEAFMERDVQELKDDLSGADVVVTTGLVLQELLQGFSGPKAQTQIIERFAALPLLRPDRDDHIDAAVLRNACRQARVQIGTIDALLAQLVIRQDLTLLCTDKYFTHAAKHCALRVWPANTRAKR